jgi:peptidoglycan/LPS O-acetylase OafA/YrhL
LANTDQIRRTASGAVFRPEIEGLRAVAATLVAVFHIWLGRVSGGVDVFFVVSGFLITTVLLSHVDRHGAPRLAVFWGRLVKRLLPAALIVLLAVVVASVFLLPEARWKETIKEIAASAVYVQNWLLAFNSVDYLLQDGPVSPVQHFWALSTQGQFYLLWPLLFLGVGFVARLTGVAFRTIAVIAIATLFAVSISYSVWITNEDQPFAYFDTFARVWEFSIGALLAIFIKHITLPAGLRFALGWVGLLAILSCGLILQVSTVFPGYAALWPTLAGAFVIIAGTTGKSAGVDRFLGSKPMVYLGSISYALYLWHFPILIFYRMHAPPGPISLLAGLSILGASVALAALTHRFVEQPVKRAGIGSTAPWHSFAFGAACAIPVVIGLGIWSLMFFDARNQERQIDAIGNPDYPGAMVFKQGFKYSGATSVKVYPGPHTVMEDRERPVGDGCGRPFSEVKPTDCTIEGVAGMPTVAVVGNSHSAHWLPALKDIAAQSGWRVVNYSKSRCPFHLADEKVYPREWKNCIKWNRNVLERVKDINPDAVFLVSTRYDNGRETVPKGYVTAWRELEATGINVIAMRDNPNFVDDISVCNEKFGADEPVCSMARNSLVTTPSPIEQLENPPDNVHFIELTDYFCDDMTCPAVIGNVMVYRDGSHITATYARSLVPMLAEQIGGISALTPRLAQNNEE